MDKSLIRGSWHIGLSNGRLINLLAFRPCDVDIKIIAHALSMQCRYGGHTRHHYSVAQHSVYVSQMIEESGGTRKEILAGLLHDGSEAYLQDLVRGIKVGIKDDGQMYAKLEDEIQGMIYRKYGVRRFREYHHEIKYWDNRVLGAEIKQLIPAKGPWRRLNQALVPAPIKIKRWSPNQAKKKFLERFHACAS